MNFKLEITPILSTITITLLLTSPITCKKDDSDAWEVEDESCLHPDGHKNYYQISGYTDEEVDKVNKTSLFGKQILDSYVGYPCNVDLYKDYHTMFREPALKCPFIGDLDKNFQTFIWSRLWKTQQKKKDGSLIDPALNRSLLFQYVCFSNQYEECVPNLSTKGKGGSCDGECKCMKEVPVQPYNYPQSKGLDASNSLPKVKVEKKIRCGVGVGGLCIPAFDQTCNSMTPGYDVALERAYKPEDFFFKCESNAGCHTDKRICECAQGFDCHNSGRGSIKYNPGDYGKWGTFFMKIGTILLWPLVCSM